MKRIRIIVLAVLMAFFFTGCSTVSTAPDEVALHYGNGPFDKKTFKACVPSGERQNFNGPADDYFHYPASQRTFDYTGGPNSDRGPFEVVSKDNQIVTIPGSVEFNLNTECGALKQFHLLVGGRNEAYNTEAGQPSNEGWAKILDLYLGNSLDAALDRVAKQYNWKELYSDPAIKDEINKQVNATLATLVNQKFQSEEEFFINFSSLALQPQADAELIAALKREESAKANAAATQIAAEADAAAAEASAIAQVKVKNADLEIERLNTAIKQEQIRAYGSIQEFNEAKAIEKGLNPYQPVYSIGGVTK